MPVKTNVTKTAKSSDAHVYFLPEAFKSKDLKSLAINEDVKELYKKAKSKRAFEEKAGALLSFEHGFITYVFQIADRKETAVFFKLEAARKIYETLSASSVKSANVYLDLISEEEGLAAADALTSAFVAGNHNLPVYKKEKAKPEASLHLTFVTKSSVKISKAVSLATSSAEAGNKIRDLLFMPANILDPKGFHEICKKEASENGFSFKYHSFAELSKKGAGAFCAVAGAAPKSGAGIAEITYSPKTTSKKLKHVVFVGKGITFDTGGVNVKPGISMLGMKGDMGGAATAYAMLNLAKKQKWNVKVTAILAICDNKISDSAYQPDEVIKSLSGKTIEIIHTDAEGRMALADALYLASQNRPDLLIDFATLTGASVRAIGNAYSSFFSNNDDYIEKFTIAGKVSGERVWPFPIDEDFGRCLSSNVADIKQCRPSGGCDHIEAAIFLKEFIGSVKNWIHVDLSSAKGDGPLAHVATKESGFGPRLIQKFLQEIKFI